MGHHRVARFGGVAVGGALLFVLALAPASAQTLPPQLQGSWKLKPELTAKLMKDLPEEAPAQGKGRGGSGHGGGGMGGGGMGSHGGSGGGAQGWDTGVVDSPADSGGSDKARAAVLAALDRLSIALAPGQVTITDRDGLKRVVKPDGSKIHDAAAPGGPAQVRAILDKDGSLVVEIKPDKGVRRIESFEVSDDGKHLYVTVAFSGGFMARDTKIMRAYDVVPAAPPDTAPAKAPSTPPPPGRR
jgi:hypothetical protein